MEQAVQGDDRTGGKGGGVMTMIEKVALAMVGNRAFAKMGHHERQQWLETARLGVAAMREPTDAMLEASENAYDRGKYAMWHWNAMIDAALAEKDAG